MNLIRLLLGLKQPYEILFFDREYKSLSGVGRRLIISLILILTLTFAAICFAVGSIQNLRVKMNDPFTNWIDVPMQTRGGINNKNVSTFLSEFDKEGVRSEFAIESIAKVGITSVSFYKRTFDPFNHPQDTLNIIATGRTIDFDSPLFKNIVNKENVLQDFTKGDSLIPQAQQLIVSKELLQILGYEEGLSGPYIFIQSYFGELVPLYIAGVVDKLPTNVNFVCSESFKNVYDDRSACGDYIKTNKRGGNQVSVLLSGDSPTTDEICKSIKSEFDTEDEITSMKLDSIRINSRKYQRSIIVFGYSGDITYNNLNELLEEKFRYNKPFILAASFESTIDCPGIDNDQIAYLQFNFGELDHVQPFALKMRDTYGVRLNMREIESKENFSLVSNLTMAISVILFAFGLLSIILYVNNQLKTHLNSIRSNLGTFKAFGLSNKFLVALYRKIIFSYLLVGVVIALVAVLSVDLIESSIVGAEESKFTAISPWLFLAIISLFIISDYVSKRTIKRILERTPGDLIYNR